MNESKGEGGGLHKPSNESTGVRLSLSNCVKWRVR